MHLAKHLGYRGEEVDMVPILIGIMDFREEITQRCEECYAMESEREPGNTAGELITVFGQISPQL